MRRLCAVALLLAACGRGDADRAAVAAVASTRHQALASRNIGLYLTLISPRYNDNGKGHDDKARELAETIVNGDGFTYQGTTDEVTVHGDRAVVRGSYTVRIRIKGETVALQGEERIRLQREKGGWRITGGL